MNEKQVLIWKEWLQWEPVILGLLSGHDLREPKLKYFLADRIKDHYSAFRMFHACRPENIESYYSHGLMPLETRRVQELNELSRGYFLNDRFPEVSPENFENALTRVDDKLLKVRQLFGCVGLPRKGMIDLVLDDRVLVERDSHYLLYGSEYLLTIAGELSSLTNRDSQEYRNVLKETGIPTIFVCDMPVERIDPQEIVEFADMLLSQFAETLPKRRFNGKPPPVVDWAFSFYSVIEPTHIVSHYHPPNIRDIDAATNTSPPIECWLTSREKALVEVLKKRLREGKK